MHLSKGLKQSLNQVLNGQCDFCNSEMVAKCGEIKIWHWAHKSKRNCDPWWESEGEWHRAWKNQFPANWQEVIHQDPSTGEKHIADVKTPTGLVIEFQHSPISPDELNSRELFYQNMIWIVDGDRGALDFSYFNMGLSMEPINFHPLAYGVVWMGTGRFLPNWADATADVYFDFSQCNVLWKLALFDKNERKGAVLPLPKQYLVDNCIKGDPIPILSADEKAASKYRREMVKLPFEY